MAALYYLGILIFFVGWLWALVVAYQTSIPWCVSVLFAPLVGAFVFALLHWRDARRPFLLQLGACVLVMAIVKTHPEFKLPRFTWW
jgi:MFS family permease